MKPLVSCGTLPRTQNPIGQFQTVTKIYTRKIFINRHTCHRCIYILSLLFSPFPHAWLKFSLKRTCFRRFSLYFGGFGHFEIRWSSDPHINFFWGVRSVHLLSESPAARAFSFSCMIILKHFSAEWLAPPQKVHFVWTVFTLSLFLSQTELL